MRWWCFCSPRMCCVLLAGQPDIGQLTLMGLVWMCMYFLAGGSLRLLSVLGVLGIATGAYLYATEPHVSSRVDRFITLSSGDTYQVDKAMDAIKSGGIVGCRAGRRARQINFARRTFGLCVRGCRRRGRLADRQLYYLCVRRHCVARAVGLRAEREHGFSWRRRG